jgi:hypothetical protein
MQSRAERRCAGRGDHWSKSQWRRGLPPPPLLRHSRENGNPVLCFRRQFSVTSERIRQIEAKALRKLKHPSRSRKMRSFLDQ